MEAPVTGPITPTPSNFEAVTSSRASAAESTGGIYQPTTGTVNGASPTQGGAGWNTPPSNAQNLDNGSNQGAKLGDFQGDPLAPAPEQPVEAAPDPDAIQEQLYDENGQPIDMQAYNAQRTEFRSKVLSALESGELPFDLLKELPITVKVNGEERQVPLEEARDGYQRRADYTRKLGEVQQLQQQAQHILQLERARNQEWRDPKALRQGLRQLGLEESFMKAAFSWADERVKYMKLPPTERALIDRLQQYEMQTQQMANQQRQQEMLARQQQQTPANDPATMHVAKQLDQLMPRAFRQHQIQTYPLSQQTFLQQLQAFCPDGEITPQRVNDAAIATKEFLQDLARIQQQQLAGGTPPQQAPANGQQGNPVYPLGPRRLAPGPRQQLIMGNIAGAAPSGAGKPGGRRPSDYMRKFGLG